VMQSHPVHWPLPEDGTFIRLGAVPTRASGAPALPCTGLWCPGQAGKPAIPQAPPLPPTTADPPQHTTGPDTPGTPASAEPGTDLGVLPDDPACGVTLCCVTG